jgi:hydrogenase maturation protease
MAVTHMASDLMTGRALIACLGNIFLSDDGFGVEVAQRLAARDLPDGVRVTDYGIRGMHLAYDLAEGYDTTILVDAVPRGGEPGTVYVIEPDTAPAREAGPSAEGLLFDAHGMQPDVVLGMAGMLGASAGRVLIVGCEPATVDEGMGLSPPVAAAVDNAVRVITRLVAGTRIQANGTSAPQADGADSPAAPGHAEENSRGKR